MAISQYLISGYESRGGANYPVVMNVVQHVAAICDGGEGSDWALFDCPWTGAEAFADLESVELVPERLCLQIDSAKQYPPAMAFARLEVSERRFATTAEFFEYYRESLERHQSAQGTSPYVMARAKSPSGIGGIEAGQFAWIVSYDPRQDCVHWVTYGDYFIYDDPASMFDVEPRVLQGLPRASQALWSGVPSENPDRPRS